MYANKKEIIAFFLYVAGLMIQLGGFQKPLSNFPTQAPSQVEQINQTGQAHRIT